MRKPSLSLSAKFLILTASMLALTACGKSSGFKASSVTTEIESAVPPDEHALPPNSADRIFRGDDSQTQAEDPIFSHERQMAKAPPSTAPDTHRDPSKPTLPSHVEPQISENTLKIVRVRLFPLLMGRRGDPYIRTTDFDHVHLSAEAGLRVRNVGSGEAIDLTGQTLEFDFANHTATLDSQVISLTEQMTLKVWPLAGVTAVKVSVSNERLAKRKIQRGPGGEIFYRGYFEVAFIPLTAKETRWSIVNFIGDEDYLRSVVASEIGHDFPLEALKAQTMAARSFVFRHIMLARCAGQEVGCRTRRFDVDPTTQYQSYLGASIEDAAVSSAVADTQSKYLIFKGSPITAMYHGNSGGHTTSAAEFFCRVPLIKNIKACRATEDSIYPYLAHIDDPEGAKLKRSGHGVGMSQMSAQAMAKAGSSSEDILTKFYPGAIATSADIAPPKEDF